MLAARQVMKGRSGYRVFALAIALALTGGCYKSLDVPNIPCDPKNATSCPKGYVCTVMAAGQAMCRRPADGGGDAPISTSEAGGQVDSAGVSEVPGKGLDSTGIDGPGGSTGEAGSALDSPVGTDTLVAGGETGMPDVPGSGGAGGIDGPGGEVNEAGTDTPLVTTTGGVPGGGGVAGTGGGAGAGGVGGTTPTAGAGGTGGVAGSGGSSGTGGTAVSRTNGSPCLGTTDCDSGKCADGVCCDQTCGGCSACIQTRTGKPDGTCTAALAGSDPHETCADETATNQCGNDGLCDGKGACRKVGTNHVCTASFCSGTSFTPASTCDGALGTCKVVSGTECGAFPCSQTDGCQTTCSTDANCVGQSYCDTTSSTCKAKKIDGDPCSGTNQCSSGYCTDGVCCHTACSGCSACSIALTGQPSGTCAAAKIDTDPHETCSVDNPPCGHDGNCDGAGACKLAASNTSCGAETCTGSIYTPMAYCTGAGACNGVNGGSCPGNLLCGSNNKCKTTCSSTTADCVSGYSCPSAGATACGSACGDGTVTGTEQCDDGNTNSGDGCSSNCQKESGWNCTGTSPTTCTPICGDSVRVGTEGCDDGNTVATDGCDASCHLSAGWACEGSPSVCLQVIYVNAAATGANDGTSWANAFTSLTTALAAATSGKQIWIAQGTYKPSTTGDRNQTFTLKGGVPIYGGFIGGQSEDRPARDWNTHATILSGDLNGDDGPSLANTADNSYHVLSAGANIAVTLDGLVVRGGNASNGGGLYFPTAGIGSVAIANCAFDRNNGSAILLPDDILNPATISNTTFTNNGGGTSGTVVHLGSSAKLRYCKFEGNSGAYVASCGVNGSVSTPCKRLDVVGCVFLANVSYAPLYVPSATDTASLTVTKSLFSGNTCIDSNMHIAAGALSISGAGKLLIADSAFVGDKCDIPSPGLAPSVLYLNTSSMNVYFYNVTAVSGAGAYAVSNRGSAYVYNSIFRESTTLGGQFQTAPTAVYSNTATALAGTGNTTADPLLDTNGVPASNSPVINAGNNTYLPADVADINNNGNTTETLPLDLAGNARIQGGTVDMGAYEVK